MKSLSSKIRITGLMYLIVIVCAGFAQGYVRANLVVPGDAAATASFWSLLFLSCSTKY